jgi:hypothetical protein
MENLLSFSNSNNLLLLLLSCSYRLHRQIRRKRDSAEERMVKGNTRLKAIRTPLLGICHF